LYEKGLFWCEGHKQLPEYMLGHSQLFFKDKFMAIEEFLNPKLASKE
jgi:hypothetical protein